MAPKVSLASINDLMNERFDLMNGRFDTITNDINEVRNVIIKNLLEENKKLRQKVSFLENKIHKTSSMIESNNQYVRRNNVEIIGIPSSVEDTDLEERVISILNEIDVPVEESDIEACHRLPVSKYSKNKNKKTIVRFVNRKKCSEIFNNNNKLKHIDTNSIKLPEGTKIFINQNLNVYFQRLSWKCRVLKRKKQISSFRYQNECFLIKMSESDKPKKVCSDEDIEKLFPDFDFEK